jgi:hypothetical protein
MLCQRGKKHVKISFDYRWLYIHHGEKKGALQKKMKFPLFLPGYLGGRRWSRPLIFWLVDSSGGSDVGSDECNYSRLGLSMSGS